MSEEIEDVLREETGRGRIIVTVVLCFVLAMTAVALALPARETAEPLLVSVLSALAVVGMCSLFLGAAGSLHFGRRNADVLHAARLTEAMPTPSAICTRRGQVVFANAAYRQFVGAGLSGRPKAPEYLYSGHADLSERIYRLSLAAREGREHTEELRIPAGSDALGYDKANTVLLKVSVRRVNKSDSKKNVLWRFEDVTAERTQQESAFVELQNMIDYLDHAPAGFYSADVKGVIHYMNATLAGWLGIELGETTSGELNLSSLIVGENSDIFSELTSKPGGETVDTFDVDLTTRDGTSLPVRIIHRVRFGDDGRAGDSQSLVLNRQAGQDVSEDLRVAEVRFARFFNSAPIGIALLDTRGKVINSNSALARLIGEKSLRGKPLTSFFDGDKQSDFNQAFAQANEVQAKISPVEVRFAKGDKNIAQLFLSPSEVLDEEGAGAVVFAVDVTEHRMLEQKFSQSSKMQAVGQLAGGVAHDFNNVLTAIIGFSDLLLTRHTPTDPSFQDIMNIKQNANRAANLVRQLLAFSRRQTLRPTVLLLDEAIGDMKILLERLLGEQVKLEVITTRDPGYVKVDLNQLEQVIMNLAVNARDAMEGGGQLILETGQLTHAEGDELGGGVMPAGEYVFFVVRDEGCGMTQEVMDNIYDPFFTTKEIGKGTGLGLSTVYGIVKQTGGFIFADSEVGKGTTFTVLLPRFYPTKAELEVDLDIVEEKPTDLSGQGTILLVEDEEAVRTFAARALQSRGYTVLEADSGLSALDLLEEEDQTIDLVVSDVVMPEMDGPTMLREIRKQNQNVKVIFISGYAEEAFEKNLDEGEEFAFLPKPFSLKQLAAAVKEALGS